MNVSTARSLVAGTGISLANADGVLGNPTITNTAPDQTVVFTNGTGISVTGTYPSFTITNTSPDQIVSLTAGTNITITGTYPNFTINSTGGATGVSSFSGGTTGLTPNTASTGAVTLGGTLAIANGGTGATTASTALSSLGAYPASNPSGYTSNVGTVTSVSGSGSVNGITLSGTVTSTGSLLLGGTLLVTPNDFGVQLISTFLAGPVGGSGQPSFRTISPSDIPTLNQNTSGTANNVTGVVAVTNGGTGLSSNALNGQIDIGNGSTFTRSTITAGTGISVVNGSGSITISNTLPASISTKGTATLNFGAYPGSNEASIAVIGQTTILTTSEVDVYIKGDATSTSYTANDHKYIAALLSLTVSTPIAGTGFTIYARSIHKLSGTVTVNWVWD